MSAAKPMVTVLMSVYNAEKDLKASIDSILNQSVQDFEFIIINDGSTDRSLEILENYARADTRVRIISHKNKGLTKSLNVGITEANGTFIARQDADDVSYPRRLEKQLKLFSADKSVVLAGGNCDDFCNGHQLGEWGSYDEVDLQKVVFLKTPFAHSTAMMRTDICRELGGYDESYKTAQDMEFWMRFAKRGKLAMVPVPILRRNIVKGSISTKRRWRQFYDGLRARWTHNKGANRVGAAYYGGRSLLLGLLPPRLIRLLKDEIK